jgi:hypothetical protein
MRIVSAHPDRFVRTFQETKQPATNIGKLFHEKHAALSVNYAELLKTRFVL